MSVPEQKQNHVRTIAVVVVILAAMLLGWYFLKRIADAPGQAAREIPKVIDQTSMAVDNATKRAAEGLKRLAAAINTKTIKTDYTSTATRLAGTSRLQIATIDQVEFFERRDSATTLGVSLPDVVVSARAPVEYTYYLDLDDDWNFFLDEKHVYAVAPTIRYNKPSVDASAIEYKIEESSILRDDEPVKEALKRTITAESYKRAEQNIQIARESARREAERFVQKFIVQAYGVDKDAPVSVVFRDEAVPKTIPEQHGFLTKP